MKPRIVLRMAIHGKAETAGSKRGFVPQKNGQPVRSRKSGQIVVSIVDDNPKSRDWKSRVADATQQQWGARPLLTEPLWFRATFYRLRPKYHFRGGKNSTEVKPDMPAFPHTTPDVLKLMRAVEDALTGIVWVDDAQIVAERIDKKYGDKPYVEIEIGVLPATLRELEQWTTSENSSC